MRPVQSEQDENYYDYLGTLVMGLCKDVLNLNQGKTILDKTVKFTFPVIGLK